MAEPRAFYRPNGSGAAPASAADAEQQLYDCLYRVVDQQLIADVPVGLLLSGGIDSSILAALAARVTKVRTISMGFAKSWNSENPYCLESLRKTTVPNNVGWAIFTAWWHYNSLSMV